MPLRSFLALFMAATLSASTITTNWTGASGAWTTPSNWSSGVAQNTALTDYLAVFGDVPPTRLISLDTSLSVTGLSLGTGNRLTIDNGKTLTLDGGTSTVKGNIFGDVALAGSAQATFQGGFSGKLTNGSTSEATFSGGQIPNLVNAAGGVINLNSAQVSGGTIANDGSITINGSFSSFNAVTVSGSGTLTLANVTAGGNGGLINSSTIEGYGTVNKSVSNSGTLTASGGELILTGGTNNSGSMGATSGGTLTIQSGFTNSGTITADTGGIVTIKGSDTSTTGTLIADGGTLNLQGVNFSSSFRDSVVAQNSGTIVADVSLFGPVTVHSTGLLDMSTTISNLTVDSGGTVKVRGGIIQTLSNSGSITNTASFTTNSFTNNAGGSVSLSGGGLFVQGPTFTNDGSVQLNGVSLTNQGTSLLNGSGTLTLIGGSLSGSLVTNGASHTIEGSGTIGLNLKNNGKTIASGGDLVFDTLLTNNGLLSAASGNVLIEVTTGNRFTNVVADALTGGAYEAHDGHSIQFIGAGSLTTNNASISLFDNGKILDYSNTALGISNNFRINNGTFRLENTTYQASSAGDFENNGQLIIGEGSVFQNGAQQPVTNAAGGTISGTGTITGMVVNQGLMAPGDEDGPGQLTVGAYSQTAGGQLDIEFGTETAWSSLEVLGNAELFGTLRLFTDGDFDAAIGSTFRILSAASMTGTGFSTFESMFFHGKTFQLERTDSGYDVEVVGTTVPEPGTFGMMLVMMAGGVGVWRRRGAKKREIA